MYDAMLHFFVCYFELQTDVFTRAMMTKYNKKLVCSCNNNVIS